jgi:hypothetical protein
MGVGYAAWSQSFDVTTSVATGELNVELMTSWDEYESTTVGTVKTSTFAYDAWASDQNSKTVAHHPGNYVYTEMKERGSVVGYKANFSEPVDISEEVYLEYFMTTDGDRHTLSIDLKDLYPGAKLKIRTYFKNTGTVPVKISSLPKDEYNSIGPKGWFKVKSDDQFSEALMKRGLVLAAYEYFGKQEEIFGSDPQVRKEDVIEPGEVVRFDIFLVAKHTMEEETGKVGDLDDLTTENRDLTYDFELIFTQATN